MALLGSKQTQLSLRLWALAKTVQPVRKTVFWPAGDSAVAKHQESEFCIKWRRPIYGFQEVLPLHIRCMEMRLSWEALQRDPLEGLGGVGSVFSNIFCNAPVRSPEMAWTVRSKNKEEMVMVGFTILKKTKPPATEEMFLLFLMFFFLWHIIVFCLLFFFVCLFF